jgi:hypothetical protein
VGKTDPVASNSFSLYIPKAQVTDSGQYILQVTNTNTLQSVRSNPVQVLVTSQPLTVTITRDPVSSVVAMGNTATFDVAISGTYPITFQVYTFHAENS